MSSNKADDAIGEEEREAELKGDISVKLEVQS